jgi:vacuolar protein sorting-associated protein VTA1
VSAPPEPFTGLIDAPSTQFSHESEEPFSTSSLPLVPTAFGEEGTSLETPPASALVPINPSDIQAQHTVLSGSPSPPSSIRSSASVLRAHQVDAKAPSEALLPSIAPYESPVDMIQGLTSTGAASTTQSPIQAPRPSSPMDLIPQNSPPPTAPYLTGSPYASAPPLPPPPSAPYVQIHRPRPPPPPPEPSPPPELTPGLIAKTQKHCRFAISALDYEDVEQARKELHAALAILGG